MSREEYLRGSLALVVAELLPPLVRHEVLADDDFAANLALATDATVTFRPANAPFKRSVLFGAIRKASIITEISVDVSDEVGRTWTLKFERNEGQSNLSISSNSEKFFVSHLGILSDQTNKRCEILNTVASRVNLSASDHDRWASLASQRSFSDGEVTSFADDINTTPVAVSDTIAGSLNDGNPPLDVLVPRSVQYYERLIGRVGEQPTIKEYSEEVLIQHMQQLLRWRKEEGLRHCLLLCSHSLVVEALGAEEIDVETLARTLQWAAQEGDAMARCASIEIALRRADVHAEIIAGLVHGTAALGIAAGEPDEQFQIFSAAFFMVYGQLAHLQILASKPPFWRRLAALAQAAIIVRCLVARKVQLPETIEVMKKIRLRPYRVQGFADLRLGPLWQSQMADAVQLRNEFVGRVIGRAAQRLEFVRSIGLENPLLGDREDGLKATVNLFLALMPGPLEDNVPAMREMSPEDCEIVTAALNHENPTAPSFAPLLNSAFLYRQPIELADLAASALRRAQFRVDARGDHAMFVASIVGLASVAAITRSIQLADAIFTVIRYYRKYSPSELDLSEAIHAGTIACASHKDLTKWATTLGNLMSELAFQDISKVEAQGLNQHILDFCELIPELWASLGPALAATEALAA